MSAAEVIVPWLPGCPYRDRAWRWVRERISQPIRVALGTDPWCKGAVIRDAILASDAEVIVVHDADVWCPGLDQAIAAVAAGEPWAIPHLWLYRLDERATANVLAGGEPSPTMPLAQARYRGKAGGGIVVAPREILLNVPMDPRFVGWGQADESWALALRTITDARPWRGEADIFHLWHPPQDRMSRRWGSPASKALHARYTAARGRPDAMRVLLAEAAEVLNG